MIPFSYDLMQPIYPLLMQQFLDDYGLERGVAVDIGTGPGNLAVELAKVSSMDLILVDLDPEALATAQRRLAALDTDNRFSFVRADVADLPLRDGLADFVMCRGSIGFWPHPAAGLREIHRILKPGGTAIVGVGAGRYIPKTMKDRIYHAMNQSPRSGPPHKYNRDQYEAMAREAGLLDYSILMEDSITRGGWIEIRKPLNIC